MKKKMRERWREEKIERGKGAKSKRWKEEKMEREKDKERER